MTALIFFASLSAVILALTAVGHFFGGWPLLGVYLFGVLAVVTIGWLMHTYDGGRR